MKRALYLLLLILIMLLFIGCANKSSADLDTSHDYIYMESTEAVKPSIRFGGNDQFQFTYSALSSYIAIGLYEVDDGYLFLKTDDGAYEYVFKIEKGTLIFDAEKSSAIPSHANVPDGAVFK